MWRLMKGGILKLFRCIEILLVLTATLWSISFSVCVNDDTHLSECLVWAAMGTQDDTIGCQIYCQRQGDHWFFLII